MWRRKKRNKVVPEADQYISQRYEDTAVRIFLNMKKGKGLHSVYVPWIQAMIVQYIPVGTTRAKYWTEQVPLYTNSVEETRVGNIDSKIENTRTIENTADSKIDSTRCNAIADVETSSNQDKAEDNVPSPQTTASHNAQPSTDHVTSPAVHVIPPLVHLDINREPLLSFLSGNSNIETTEHSNDNIPTSKYCIIL